jgi:preprotein translocase subunit YajC
MPQLAFIAVLFGVMYLVTVRPQQQRLKAQRALVASLQVGDEVLTAGGLIGRIVVLGDREVRLDVGGTEVRVIRAAVTDRTADDSAL